MNWYALYTKSRCEKKVNEALQQQGIECYCPTTIVKKKWSDRIKKVEQPLFTSYVFVKIIAEQHIQVKQTNNVVNFVYWLSKPAIIKEQEIEAIKNFITKHQTVSLEKVLPKVGEKIEIATGLFKGQKAIINKIFKNKLELILPTLGLKLVAPLK